MGCCCLRDGDREILVDVEAIRIGMGMKVIVYFGGW
jgi:hypothetical protein